MLASSWFFTPRVTVRWEGASFRWADMADLKSMSYEYTAGNLNCEASVAISFWYEKRMKCSSGLNERRVWVKAFHASIQRVKDSMFSLDALSKEYVPVSLENFISMFWERSSLVFWSIC